MPKLLEFLCDKEVYGFGAKLQRVLLLNFFDRVLVFRIEDFISGLKKVRTSKLFVPRNMIANATGEHCLQLLYF